MFLCVLMAVAVIGCTKTQPLAGTDTTKWKDLKLTVAGYRLFNDDPLNYEFAAGAEKFTAEYGTQVEFIVGGGDGLGDDLVAAITSGNPWELQYVFGISSFPAVATAGLYQPITKYVDFDKNKKIDKLTVDGTIWKGETYGISTKKMQEFNYIVYNETWMKELGVKTPHEMLAEGKWDRENFIKLVADLKKLNANCASNYARPHTVGTYMSKWENDAVTVTYDSEENVQWLNMWAKFIHDPEYQFTGGLVSKREVIMREEVFPNMIKDETNESTADTLRYIHWPREKNDMAGAYLTDSHFFFPDGVPEEKIACAVELASWMCDEKATLVDKLYQEKMTADDYALLKSNYDKFYFIPRFFSKEAWPTMSGKFTKDVNEGKPVATHIQENMSYLKSLADEFNAEFSK